MPKDETDLDVDDITFLRTAREINANPEDYSDQLTSAGAVPATISAIRNETDLSQNQLNYRMRAGDNSRGFVDRGLIDVHPAEVRDDGSYGPKSVELTEKGERRLDAAMRAHGLGQLAAPELHHQELVDLEDDVDALTREVAGLRQAVEGVREDLAAVSESVSNAEGRPHGFTDEETATQLDAVTEGFPVIDRALENLLGVPMDELAKRRGNLDDEDYAELRQEVAKFHQTMLGESDDGGDGPQQATFESN